MKGVERTMNVVIGVIRKQCAPASRPPRTVAASDAFAARIAGHYSAGRLTASRAELALAYEAPVQVNYFQNARLDIVPSVVMHDYPASAPEPRETAAVPEGARFGEAQAAALFERLFSRQKRVAAFAGNGLPKAVGPNGAQEMRPMPFSAAKNPEAVERVFRRPASIEKAEGRTGGAREIESTTPEMGWGSRPILPTAPKAFTLPEPEVKRVADQVMREIDHRVIARRERMGRR